MYNESLICKRCGMTGHCAQRDSVNPELPAGHNCRIAIGYVKGDFSMPPQEGQKDDTDKLDLALNHLTKVVKEWERSYHCCDAMKHHQGCHSSDCDWQAARNFLVREGYLDV